VFLVSRNFILDDKDYLKAQRNQLMANQRSKNDSGLKIPLLEVAEASSQMAEKRPHEKLERLNNCINVKYPIADYSYFLTKEK
jgi:hypothetical protein